MILVELSILMVKNRMVYIYGKKSDFKADLSMANKLSSFPHKEKYESENTESQWVIRLELIMCESRST